MECRLVGAARKRIRPLPEPLVKPVVERAQMSQEELYTKKYLARLKWIEEERKRAAERKAREQEAIEKRQMKIEEQLSRENEILEARKAKLLEAALRRQAAIDEEKKMRLEASLHSKSVKSRVTALKPGLSVIENLFV